MENGGDTISWRALSAFTAVTTPLSEGVTPDSMDISITAVTATVEEYGAFVRYTRKLAAMGIDKVAAEASDALGEQAGDSLDQLTRNVIVAGSTVQYASTATTRGTVTSTMKLTAAEVLEAVATLKNNKAQPVMDGYFIGVIHPYVEFDVFQDPIFTAIFTHARERDNQKSDNNPWTAGFVGKALGVEWYVSANAKVFIDEGSGSTDVHGTMILGKSAFGIAGLAAHMPQAVKGMQQGNNTMTKVKPLRLIQKDFASGGSTDPMEQRATIAWYTTFVAKRLREAFMVRIEHASTIQS